MAMESRYEMTKEHVSHDPNFFSTQADPNRIKNPCLGESDCRFTLIEEFIPCHTSMFDHIVAQFNAQANEWAIADTPEKRTAFYNKYDPPKKKEKKKTPAK